MFITIKHGSFHLTCPAAFQTFSDSLLLHQMLFIFWNAAFAWPILLLAFSICFMIPPNIWIYLIDFHLPSHSNILFWCHIFHCFCLWYSRKAIFFFFAALSIITLPNSWCRTFSYQHCVICIMQLINLQLLYLVYFWLYLVSLLVCCR